MTKPIEIKRTDPAMQPADTFAPGRPKEAPKQKVRPILLPANSESAAALAKEVEKEEEAKEKLYWEQVKRLEHESEFNQTSALFLFEEEEETKKAEPEASN